MEARGGRLERREPSGSVHLIVPEGPLANRPRSPPRGGPPGAVPRASARPRRLTTYLEALSRWSPARRAVGKHAFGPQLAPTPGRRTTSRPSANTTPRWPTIRHCGPGSVAVRARRWGGGRGARRRAIASPRRRSTSGHGVPLQTRRPSSSTTPRAARQIVAFRSGGRRHHEGGSDGRDAERDYADLRSLPTAHRRARSDDRTRPIPMKTPSFFTAIA